MSTYVLLMGTLWLTLLKGCWCDTGTAVHAVQLIGQMPVVGFQHGHALVVGHGFHRFRLSHCDAALASVCTGMTKKKLCTIAH